MGRVFVEIGADPARFFAAIQGIQKSIGRIGSAMSSLGTRMAGVGAAFGAPFVGAVVAGSKFQDVLLNIKASTGATAGQLEQVKSAAMAMSSALGVGPTEAAQGFLELLKAGMSVEQVLSGAGQSALQFAKVGEMAVADAAVVMADAMNVFKVSGDVAANTLSSAADASSTSIQGISLAFSQVSAVAALANQSIQDTGAALAVLANAGIKGSDAGTSLKTMLMRLMAPADDAAEALASIGLSTDAFRNADGTMKPMVEIIRTLTQSMGDMDQAARDDMLRRIFGADAIRAAAVFMQVGVDGFNAMQDGMNEALPVGEKFDAMMGGLSGAAKSIYAAMERLAIAVTDAVGPSLVALAQPIADVIGGLATFISKNQELVLSIAKGVAIFTGVGLAIAGVGTALTLVAGAMGLVLSPVGAILAAVTGLGAGIVYFAGGLSGLADLANTTFSGIYAAIAEGDLAGAMDILWLGLYAGWLKGVEGLMAAVDPWVSLFQNTFTYLSATVLSIWDGMVNAMAASWDAMESSVRKGWNFLQAAFKGAEQVALDDVKIDQEMADRRRKRESQTTDRMDAADKAAENREDQNRANRAQRTADSQQADANLANATGGKRETRARNDQFSQLLKDVEGATTMDALRGMYEEFDALASNGRLTSAQMATLETALEDAQERVSKSGSSMGGSPSQQIRDNAGAAAAESGQSSAEVAGTFSSMALGGLGFGSSLAQKQLDTLKSIEQNTRASEEGLVGV
jgi:TP901 family phage tail tape measure protein